MNYREHYNKLVSRAVTRVLTEYSELHHIIPKCVGGNNDPNNLVKLTPEEHYVAHQLLVKIYSNNSKLVHAAMMMGVASGHHDRNNKQYGWLKRKHTEVCRKRVGNKNPSYGKSWFYNPVTLVNIKCKIDDVPEGWVKGRFVQSKPRIRHCAVCGNEITDKKHAKFCFAHRQESESGAKNRFNKRKDLFLQYIKEGYSFDKSLKMVGYKNYNMKFGVGKRAQELLDSVGVMRPLFPKRPPKTLA